MSTDDQPQRGSQAAAAEPPLTMSAADLDESDVAAVMEVLRSGRLALGPWAERFEAVLAEYVGVRHGIAVSSGTAGLHVLVRALGLGPGDEVLVPSFTFVASVTPLLFEGVTPVFLEIEGETFNLDPEELERRRTPRTKAVMVVDAFGHPAPWDELQAFAGEHDLHLIDDCCEALGAEHRGTKLGALGEAGVFAFYPNKQMTTGEGGLIVTDDDELAAVARSLRNQGRSSMGQWLAHERLGYNYRLDEMSAALGCSQLARLEDFLRRRQRVADLYARRLDGLPFVRPPQVADHVRMSWFVYVVLLEPGLDRQPVMDAMAEQGVPTRAYFSPIHLQPFIRQSLDTAEGDLPVTEDLARRTIALPFHNRLQPEQVDRVVTALEQAVRGLGRSW
ncbi:MAG: DegT/DnrJ/EryC1/StrS family aminotransferase [Acidobacteriota bacterium]|nr:DegT/DnrJ/EryC1/StrS family aminotransferase [Acidobacteriota bacterium]